MTNPHGNPAIGSQNDQDSNRSSVIYNWIALVVVVLIFFSTVFLFVAAMGGKAEIKSNCSVSATFDTERPIRYKGMVRFHNIEALCEGSGTKETFELPYRYAEEITVGTRVDLEIIHRPFGFPSSVHVIGVDSSQRD